MSALYGYFDLKGELPDDCAENMAHWSAYPADRNHTLLRGSGFAVGCVSKGIYPGEGEVLAGQDATRRCMFVGRILCPRGGAELASPVEAARSAFVAQESSEALGDINGSFAAAVWDDGKQHLELITDRYGNYPLYVARHGQALLFATRIAAIVGAGVVDTRIDPVSAALMLSIGELVGDKTPLDSITVMPSGSRLICTRERQTTKRYWQFTFSEEDSPIDATAKNLGHALKNGVWRACLDNLKIGVPLSGGLDSRVLLAATPELANVHSFTWGLAGCRDLRYGAAAAAALGSPHQGFVYDGGYLSSFGALGVWLTEGQLPATDFHVLPYVEEVSARCEVILNGYAGDVILGGNFVKRAWWQASGKQQAGDALWAWRQGMLPSQYKALFGREFDGVGIDDAKTAFVQQYQDTPGETPMDAAMAFLLDNRIRRRTLCGTSLMRWRVESEQPFFDNDFMEAVSKVPYTWLFRHKLYLKMLRACFPVAAKVKWQRTGLPAGAPRWMRYLSLAAHKVPPLRPLFRGQRVSDFAGWMRGPLKNYVSTTLTGSQTLDRGLVDPDTVRRVVSDHISSKRDNSSLIGSLLSLELFARIYVDRDRTLLDRCQVAPPPLRAVTMEQAV